MSFGLVKHNNNSISAITSAGQLAQGKMTLIKEQTASSSASIEFVHGSSSVVFDNTYPIYLFKYFNMHPASGSTFSFLGSTNSGSGYGVTKTSTSFYATHKEDDSTTALSYNVYQDLAQSTSRQGLIGTLSTDSDSGGSGELFIFDPSNTTHVKHYISTASGAITGSQMTVSYTAGYFNTTSAIDAIKFEMSSGNIDSGTIKLYGIKGS